MSAASTKTSMLAVVGLAPLRTTVQADANYTRQHANLLMPGQIVSGLVCDHIKLSGKNKSMLCSTALSQ
jgi:uncharacterized membrane protein YdcZ (DUF606 family)